MYSHFFRITFVAITILVISSTTIQAQENYQLEVDGKVVDIQLDKSYDIEIGEKTVKVQLTQKDLLTYSDEFVSFQYPKEFKVASSRLDAEITQLMLMTAEGAGFIIQEYSTINPTMMKDLMMSEVTKESINYGFEAKEEEYEKTLNSGKKITVDRTVLTYKDEVDVYEIAAAGKKDAGVLIVTIQSNSEEFVTGKELIDLVWNSLEIH